MVRLGGTAAICVVRHIRRARSRRICRKRRALITCPAATNSFTELELPARLC